jgi:hypothetical protein
MSNWTFIIAAYTLTWATLIGYAFYLRRVRHRAEALHEEAVRQTRGTER